MRNFSESMQMMLLNDSYFYTVERMAGARNQLKCEYEPMAGATVAGANYVMLVK